MAILFEESFEATGYDNSGWSESVGSGATVDEDYATSNVGSPSGWGSRCLRIIHPASAVNAYASIDTNIDAAIAYWRFELQLVSESLANGDIVLITQVQSSSSADAFQLTLYQKWDGKRHIRCVAYNVGGGTQYIYGPEILDNTKQVVEVKWDFTNKSFVYRIDGTDVSTYTIDAAGAANTAKVVIGSPSWTAAKAYEMVWDNVAAASDGFLGEASSGTTYNQTVEGSLSLGGSLTTTHIEPVKETVEGALSLSGSVTLTLENKRSVEGSLTLGGSLQRTYNPGGVFPPTIASEEYASVSESTAIYEIWLYGGRASLSAFKLGTARLGLSALTTDDYISRPIVFLEGWSYLSFTQKVNDAHYHQLRFDVNPEDPLVDVLRSLLNVDNIMEIYRYDPYTGVKELAYEGFNRTVVDQTRATGTLIFTLYGAGYTELLKRRQLVPLSGQEHVTFSGPAETVAKKFVESQLTNPADFSRAVPGFVIEADQGRGSNASYSGAYVNLFTALTNVAEQGNIDFGVVKLGSLVGQFQFQARPIWGLDRRVGNPDRAPLIFSQDLGNMSIPINSENASEEITVVYVGGGGQGVERVIQEVKNTSRIAASDWNRREDFYDARGTLNRTQLTALGNVQLADRSTKDTLTFELISTPGCRWLRDWRLGDLVTAFYAGKRYDKQIVEVSVTVTGTGEAKREIVTAEIEDVLI